MCPISSPKSIATRGRLISIEGGSNLQPALVLEAKTRGKLVAKYSGNQRNVIHLSEPLEAKTLNRLEMKHVG